MQILQDFYMMDFKQIKDLGMGKQLLPVNQVLKENLDTNDLSKFSSEFGVIGRNIYIPKLIHGLGNTKASTINDIKYSTNEEYPHIEIGTNHKEDHNLYKFISLIGEYKFSKKKYKLGISIIG